MEPELEKRTKSSQLFHPWRALESCRPSRENSRLSDSQTGITCSIAAPRTLDTLITSQPHDPYNTPLLTSVNMYATRAMRMQPSRAMQMFKPTRALMRPVPVSTSPLLGHGVTFLIPPCLLERGTIRYGTPRAARRGSILALETRLMMSFLPRSSSHCFPTPATTQEHSRRVVASWCVQTRGLCYWKTTKADVFPQVSSLVSPSSLPVTRASATSSPTRPSASSARTVLRTLPPPPTMVRTTEGSQGMGDGKGIWEGDMHGRQW